MTNVQKPLTSRCNDACTCDRTESREYRNEQARTATCECGPGCACGPDCSCAA